MTKVTSAVISPVDDMHLWYHWMRTVHHLQSLLPKIGKPSINIRKAPDRPQLCLKAIKNKENLRRPHAKGASEDMAPKYNVIFWRGPWSRNRILGGN